MQYLLAALAPVLTWIGRAIILKAIVAFGLGIGTYVGLDSLMTETYAYIRVLLQGVPSVLLDIAATLQIGKAISILMSAVTIRVAMRSMGGSFSMLLWGRPGSP